MRNEWCEHRGLGRINLALVLPGLLTCFPFGLTARADLPTPRLRGNPQYIVPQAVAGVRWDGRKRWELTTPWMPYLDGTGEGGIAHPTCGNSIAFDCFEAKNERIVPARPTDGAAQEGYDPECGVGGDRWYFGEEFCDGWLTANDMTICPLRKGLRAERVEFAWYWGASGPGSSEYCLVAIFTADDFDATCAGPAVSNLYEGVIYDLGPRGPSDGYYYVDVSNLCTNNLYHQMPFDGEGAYVMTLAQNWIDTDGDGNLDFLVPATCAQPMLWGTKQPENCSQQGRMYWQDAPRDGELTAPDDCVPLDWGLCPDPLGAMVLFYAVPQHILGDANCDSKVDFFDIDAFLDVLFNGIIGCNYTNIDMDFNEIIDLQDLEPLIQCILNGGC